MFHLLLFFFSFLLPLPFFLFCFLFFVWLLLFLLFFVLWFVCFLFVCFVVLFTMVSSFESFTFTVIHSQNKHSTEVPNKHLISYVEDYHVFVVVLYKTTKTNKTILHLAFPDVCSARWAVVRPVSRGPVRVIRSLVDDENVACLEKKKKDHCSALCKFKLYHQIVWLPFYNRVFHTGIRIDTTYCGQR